MLDTSVDLTETLERLEHIERQLSEYSATIDKKDTSKTFILSSINYQESLLLQNLQNKLFVETAAINLRTSP